MHYTERRQRDAGIQGRNRWALRGRPTRPPIARLPLDAPEHVPPCTSDELVAPVPYIGNNQVHLLGYAVRCMAPEEFSERSAVNIAAGSFELFRQRFRLCENFVRDGYRYFHTTSITTAVTLSSAHPKALRPFGTEQVSQGCNTGSNPVGSANKSRVYSGRMGARLFRGHGAPRRFCPAVNIAMSEPSLEVAQSTSVSLLVRTQSVLLYWLRIA